MRKFLPLLAALGLAGCATLPGMLRPAVQAVPVPLNARDPAEGRIGGLRYLGGLELRSAEPRFGGLSSLRWRDGRLHGVIDEGGWFSLAPVERDGRLVGVREVAIGRLQGPDGRPVEGKAASDAESLARDGRGWLVGFERNHRIWRYRALGGPAEATRHDPVALFGTLRDNEGVEALASRPGRTFFCAERLPAAEANCAMVEPGGGVTRIALAPPEGLDARVGWPTDAEFGADGTLYVLFRSWSGGSDNRAAILARAPDGALRTLALFVAPYTVDNMEGLAVREEGRRTFLYLVSDDNFARREQPANPSQRTLLLKFEVVQ